MDPFFPAPSSPLFMDRETAAALRQILVAHCNDADASCAALIEESGTVCALAGDDSLHDHGETAALAAGAYHAVRETARRLGESAFEGLSHEGRHKHFHLGPVDSRFLILTIFNNDTRLALVRACSTRSAARLRDCLAAQPPPPPPRASASPLTRHRLNAEEVLGTTDFFRER